MVNESRTQKLIIDQAERNWAKRVPILAVFAVMIFLSCGSRAYGLHACTPTISCAPNVCGVQSDGCHGFIDYGPCGVDCAAAACDDGDLCNGIETCDPFSGCLPGTPVVCDDANACNGLETCNPFTGGCVAGTALRCDDNNICNGLETCAPASGCVTGTALTCNDNNVCNGVEACDSVRGCVIVQPALRCDDSNACNGVETCNPVSGCVAGTALVCDDRNVCNGVETCDSATGCVIITPPPACDDGNPCNGVETCSPASGCQTAPPACLPDSIQSCTTSAGYPGTRTCLADCSSYSTCTSTMYCGDNAVNGPEECDPLGSIGSCTTSTGYPGSRTCGAGCAYGTCSTTLYCGDGTCTLGPERCPACADCGTCWVRVAGVASCTYSSLPAPCTRGTTACIYVRRGGSCYGGCGGTWYYYECQGG